MSVLRERPKVYLAGPLFSEAERSFNTRLKRMLLPYLDVYLPQEDGGLMVEMIEEGTPPSVAARRVFERDKRALYECDAFLIVLDGRAVDEGAAFEMGCAYTLGKPCYGLKTDPRQLLQCGDNPMIRVPLTSIFSRADELVEWAQAFNQQFRTAIAQAPVEIG